MSNRLVKTLRKMTKPKRRGEMPAVLGLASGVVRSSTRAGYVYARLYNGMTVECYNVNVPAIAGLEVVVGYSDAMPGVLQVLRSRQPVGYPIGTVGVVAEHGETHRYPAQDTVWVEGTQIMPLNVLPGGGMTINVYGGALPSPAGGWVSVSDTSLDLSASKPSTKARWVLVQIADGTVSTKNGNEKASREQLGLADIPAPDNGYVGIAAVRVYAGQEAIRRDAEVDDIVDLRWLAAVETDPIFRAHPACGLTAQNMTDISNLSGTNTGDQAAADVPIEDAGGYYTSAHVEGALQEAGAALSGKIPEAPEDGKLYGRKDAGWVEVSGGGGIPEAPEDGKLYGRKDAGWEEVPAVPTPSDDNPSDVGDTASSGTSDAYSRADHVHAGVTDVESTGKYVRQSGAWVPLKRIARVTNKQWFGASAHGGNTMVTAMLSATQSGAVSMSVENGYLMNRCSASNGSDFGVVSSTAFVYLSLYPMVEFLWKTDASVDGRRMWVGLFVSLTAIGTGDTQTSPFVAFRYSTNAGDTTFQFMARAGGVNYQLDTGISIATNTLYRMTIWPVYDAANGWYLKGRINDDEFELAEYLSGSSDLLTNSLYIAWRTRAIAATRYAKWASIYGEWPYDIESI